mmetsp:Transcript_66980/g.195824  ORF Transcript_66980/g.195824 Transcript_66980/m.195824 type:complete len:375 (-) Transcript_66980:105-1229(-)
MSSQGQLASVAIMGTAQNAERQNDVVAGMAMLAVAAGVWVLETRRRNGTASREPAGEYANAAPGEGLAGPRVMEKALKMGTQLAPEACGAVLCLAIAGVILVWGSSDVAPGPDEDKEIWQHIRDQWPLLVTADSLLGLRAMVRMLLLLSAVFRTEESLISPFAGEPAFLMLLAALSRVVLLVLSPQDVYHLDGPLGGIAYMGLEVASLGPLLFLAVGGAFEACQAPSSTRLIAAAMALVLAGRTAWTNRLALGGPGDAHLDVLFSLGELLELAAAAAFLLRVLWAAGHESTRSAFAAVAHLLLPLQQLLSAYFMLTAWGGTPLEEISSLVGAGRPFEALQLGGAAQVGAYAVAAAAQLVFVSAADKEEDVGVQV